MPLVSVLMAVHNNSGFLREAVESIFLQTCADLEFIIVDDGSDEETARELDGYAALDPRVSVHHLPHQGLTKALNAGLAFARGAYLARMDSDDVAHPNRLEEQVDFLQSHPEVTACGTWADIIDETGKKIGEKQFPVENEAIKKKLLFNNQFVHASMCFRTQVLCDVGGYNEAFHKSQDYELMLRLAATHNVANLPVALLSWRLRRGSISWSGKKQEWHAIRARFLAITKYGYPKITGLGHILLRLLWLPIPQSFKFRRYAV